MDTSGPRLLWPDLSKGLCILLVVLHHATVKHHPEFAPALLQGWTDAWVALTYALKPVRMPLFFVLSGFFAARALTRPAPAVLLRVATSGYLYLVWLVLLMGFFALERSLETNRTQDVGELVADLLWPSTSLWFLWALGAYLLLLRVLRRVPDTWVLLGGAVAAAASSAIPVDESNRISVVFHFVFFAAGALRPDAVRRLALAPGRLLVLGPLFAVLSVVAVVWVELPRGVEQLALSGLGVPLGLALAAALARVPAVAGPLAWVGRRTLPVYVLHLPLLALLVHAPLDLGSGLTTGSRLAAALSPLVVTTAVVAGCLLLHALALRTGLSWLFALPAPVADRLSRRRGDADGRWSPAGAGPPPPGRARARSPRG